MRHYSTRARTPELFEHIEYLRKTAQIPILDLSNLFGVSERTYHNWLQGALPDQSYEPWMRKVSSLLEEEIKAGNLPAHGTPRSNRVIQARNASMVSVQKKLIDWLMAL